MVEDCEAASCNMRLGVCATTQESYNVRVGLGADRDSRVSLPGHVQVIKSGLVVIE